MEFSKLMPLPELHAHCKEYFEQIFDNDDDLLEDAFSHGLYHEEEFRFGLLAARLSDSELASLFLPIGHALIRGTTGGRIEEVRRLYEAFSEWQNGQLKDKQRLTDDLAVVRSSVFDLSRNWAPAAVPFYRVLELGINERLARVLTSFGRLKRDIRFKRFWQLD
jgi:hypothetical protein